MSVAKAVRNPSSITEAAVNTDASGPDRWRARHLQFQLMKGPQLEEC